tara:strand:- start:930 stop:2414 length:1485 start_codon:yes stop_codon:yes gene_type:complete
MLNLKLINDMKNLLIALALTGALQSSAQTVFTDFESSNGNRGAETCWGFGGFSLSNRSSHNPINGYSARSGSLNANPSAFWLKSPFIIFESGNITFNTRLSSADGASIYRVYIDFIEYDENDNWGEGSIVSGSTFTYTSPQNSVQAVSVAVPSSIVSSGNPYKVYLRFESQGGNRNRRALVDDIVIPGTFASDPSNNCKPITAVADSDFDGVADDVDLYPNDANAVYDYYFPAVDPSATAPLYGTIAYEDLWPSKGDYDFNDLVLDHYTRFTFNASSKVTRVQFKFSVRALGGDLIQGFGVHFPDIPAALVNAVSGNSLTTGTISTTASGAENGQTNAVIIACDDVEQIINRASGAFFNTYSANPKGTSDTLTVDVSFTSGVAIEDIMNFSIFAFKQRNQEIHMVNKKPTDLVDLSLFGTEDDASDPASGQYYKTADSHPWAIFVGESFDYPEEKVDIVQAYLNFANWAQSNGSSSTSWYKDESGNRQEANIFQ